MPTYEYKCEGCGHAFEKFQKMTDPPVRTCPNCKARKVRRLIGTGAGIIFKGSGFYATDYRSDSYRSAARKEKDGGSTSSSSGKKDSGSVGSEGSKKTAPASSSSGGSGTD